jgi:hypothetical protein
MGRRKIGRRSLALLTPGSEDEQPYTRHAVGWTCAASLPVLAAVADLQAAVPRKEVACDSSRAHSRCSAPRR